MGFFLWARVRAAWATYPPSFARSAEVRIGAVVGPDDLTARAVVVHLVERALVSVPEELDVEEVDLRNAVVLVVRQGQRGEGLDLRRLLGLGLGRLLLLGVREEARCACCG